MLLALLVGTRFTAFLCAGLLAAGAVFEPEDRALRRVAAGGLLFASLALVVLETGEMAGDPAAGLDLRLIGLALSTTPFGWGSLARLLVCLLLLAPLGRAVLGIGRGLAAAALGSLAFNGHGASDGGALGLCHLGVDALHLLAGGTWIGALVLLSRALRLPPAEEARRLSRFSGWGSGLVAVLVLTGILNLLLLVRGEGLAAAFAAPWGRLLLVKLVLFVLMLALAALNRWRLTSRLAAQGARTGAGGSSLLAETGLGLLVLALVAALGLLPPAAA